MASINGISVKGIKKFFGHEGEPLLQGNLYLGNKKIGQWSQDSWGGPDNFILDLKYSQHLLNEAVMALNADKTRHFGDGENGFVMKYNLERLITDYLDLAEDEKAFTKALRGGYSGIVVATDGRRSTIWSLPKNYAEMSDEGLLKELGPSLEKAKRAFQPESDFVKHEVRIYRSQNEFTVGEAISPEAITRKKDLNNIISVAQKTARESKSPAGYTPFKDMPKDPER